MAVYALLKARDLLEQVVVFASVLGLIRAILCRDY